VRFDEFREIIVRHWRTPVCRFFISTDNGLGWLGGWVPAIDARDAKLAEKISPENWLELALTSLDDETTFEYQTKEQEYIPFENASAGQQATALLMTLLNQAGPPLAIDQPEDDLDNQIIFEIVKRVWKAKTRRQLIFSSHNANLVVNGDSELVVWCDYLVAGDFSRGQIASEGAIDIPKIREIIKSIMEGGEKAFKLRRTSTVFRISPKGSE
jgi:chromosome segregation protein